MDILLVRHGEAAAHWGQHSDPGLSELGRSQAETVARALRGRVAGNWQLYSSPLARARETAAPLAELLQRPVTIDAVFREIPSPAPLAERKTWLRQFMTERWSTQSEDLHAWREAILSRLESLQGPAVVFTHFLVINTVVAAIEGRDETLHFWPDNGSITSLRRHSGGRHSGGRHSGGRVHGGLELVELGNAMPTQVN